MSTVRAQIHAEWACLSRGAPKPDVGQMSLAEFIRTGTIHYGDPPHHDIGGEFCHAGCTMNCDDLAVVEYWRRDEGDWRRDTALEITLPTEEGP